MSLIAVPEMAPPPSRRTGPVAPSAEQWQAMTPQARSAFLEEIHDVLNAQEQADFMSEGRPHARAKSKVLDKLGRHFRRIGRPIYLASELPVLYSGEPVIKPDVMAVLDVEDPGDKDERMAWVVAEEGRGLDLALEVHFAGDEQKDFVDNVVDYARMGIQEYFIYDRRRQALHGYRLAAPGSRRYQKMRPRFGRLPSQVLGLDLLVYDGRLRFYSGDGELPDSDELIARIEDLVDEVQRAREEAEARAQQEQARAQQEQARAQQEQARSERALGWLRGAVLNILSFRKLDPSEALVARIRACEDQDQLGRWAERALAIEAADELLD